MVSRKNLRECYESNSNYLAECTDCGQRNRIFTRFYTAHIRFDNKEMTMTD
jgi:hypothetical protein